MSIDSDIAVLVIFLFVAGPAFVFVMSTKSWLSICLTRKTGKIIPLDNNSPPLHREYLAYVFFPLALAFALWFMGLLGWSPYEDLKTDYLGKLEYPVWLVKYAVFMFIVSVPGALLGVIMAQSFRLMLEIMGVSDGAKGVNSPDQDSVAKEESRTKRKASRNRRRN